MTDLVPIRRALVSVSDKTGLEQLAAGLVRHGAEILSTGGSAQTLRQAGFTVTEAAEYSGVPELLGGRVKTLAPRIHAGILARRDDPRHLAEMAANGIAPIDLVCVNLYPFDAMVAKGAAFDACLENIDVGGPALIRAAAKNHEFVTVLTDPGQYEPVLSEIDGQGGTRLATRRRLARDGFALTAGYDASVASWFAGPEIFPERLVVPGTLLERLRYGENPHQDAALYATPGPQRGIAAARQVQGKELSYNNIADADAALDCVAEFESPAAVIVKHANPCGAAIGASLAEAWERALRCDPQSAFGGIVALNRRLDIATAELVAGVFIEMIVAPDADEAALAVLARKRNLRLLLTNAPTDPASPGLIFRTISGGILAQTRDNGRVAREQLRVVTRRAPSDAEITDLLFAFRVCKHVKSNAIVYARDGATVGIGGGQTSRVDAARLAAWKAAQVARAAGSSGPATKESVVASDAFFPFADGLQAALAAGATAVIQPGGSVRDAEVIAAADAAGAAMVFTGVRHFRH